MIERPKEISVSEFFEKNKHILGYSNPAKAMVTCVKEAVDNSVTWDTPIIVKTPEGVRIVEIGRLIDEQFEKYRKFVERHGDLEKLRVFDHLEVLSFDANYRLRFRKVSTLFRHKVNSKIYRVWLEGGRFVDLTDYHSLFTIVNGKIKPVKVSELRVGDWIVVPRRPWDCGILKEINLIEEVLKLPEELTRKIRVYGIRDKIDLINLNVERRKINDFKKCDSMPINLLRKMPKEERRLFYDCFIGYGMGKYKIKCRLVVNRELAEFLGLFVAKGSILKDLTRVVLSFGSHEKELINYTINLIRQLFGIEPSVVKPHKTAVNICISSKILGFILKYVFKVGSCAKTKRIPPIVFQMGREDREAFLIAYLSGDGYPTKVISNVLVHRMRFKDLELERVIFATSSEWLAVDMQYLLSSLGLSYSLTVQDGKERTINGKRIMFSRSYNFYIYVKQKFAHVSKIPIEVVASCNDSKLRYGIKRCNQRFVFIESLQGKDVELSDCNLLDGDLGRLTVKKIEEIEYNKMWVYDVSVPDCENFTAGFGPILCHNSLDACEEARILPDILVRIDKIDRHYKIIIEDNGPGIEKGEIPKIFGKLLYGSRFHTLKQSRGQQGIGISSAVLYAQLTTGKPTKVVSKTRDEDAWLFEILIDTRRNEPEVVREEKVEWYRPHGLRVELEIEGSYVKGRRQSVYEYLRQTSIVNPHAKITFIEPDGEIHEFERVSYEIPKIPKAIKPHPHGIEIGNLLKMLKDSRAKNLKEFLKREFSRVGEKIAEEILTKAGIPNKHPRAITREEAIRLIEAFRETPLLPPPTDCLSPIGEELIIKSLVNEFKPEFVCAVSRKPKVYSGNPFLVEVGLAYGVNSEETILMRFANRIPLLYQQGGCALTKAVESVNWKAYGIPQDKLPKAPMVILIHVASTNIPYTSESKEAIAGIPEIVDEVRLALQEVGRKLKGYLDRKKAVQERKKRENVLLKILPLIAKKCAEILEREEVDVSKVVARITGKVYVEKSVEGKNVKIVVSNFSRNKKRFKLYDICGNPRVWELELKPFEEKVIEYECENPSRSRPFVEGLEEEVIGADFLF